jgi:3-deoxy-D-manno-octulosonic-acid transferase
LLANARLSPRSAARYAKTRVLWQSVLAGVTHIAARNAQDHQGFLAMGASDSQLSVVGNIKYDLPDTTLIRQQGRKQRAHLGLSSRFVWCFASTHRGEDERALSAHQALLRQHPEALLILVPRHPERFDAVHALVAKQGLRQSRWSECEAPNTSDQVFLLDVIGQLMPHFALSDVAVIGGSFVEVGGHNPIEPASLGVPVITGPVIFNFRQEYADLMAQGAAISVEDTEVLTQALLALAVDTKRREHAGQQGLSLVEQNRGVTARLMQRVATLLAD